MQNFLDRLLASAGTAVVETDTLIACDTSEIYDAVELMRAHRHDYLDRIARRDPAGDYDRTTAPTEADYAEHKRWAIATFGEKAWEDYCTPGWGSDSFA